MKISTFCSMNQHSQWVSQAPFLQAGKKFSKHLMPSLSPITQAEVLDANFFCMEKLALGKVKLLLRWQRPWTLKTGMYHMVHPTHFTSF